jgi:competence protein ComEA
MVYKWFISVLFMVLSSLSAAAAIDLNKANQADLESIKGIGPAMSGRILDERKKAEFKDWLDFIDRIKGVGPGNAAKFSDAGLTVGGASYTRMGTPPAKGKARAASASDAKAAATADKKP